PSGFWFSTIFLVVSGVVFDLRLTSVEDTVSAVCCTLSVVCLATSYIPSVVDLTVSAIYLPQLDPQSVKEGQIVVVDSSFFLLETFSTTIFSQDSRTSFINFSSLI
ncbi:hypothetical protein GLOIN_2v1697633, partial [Rhizophagus irregularis DAOM 181602=DAOM 197198]